MNEETKFTVPVLFTAPSGSKLYGTDTKSSDTDVISIYLPTHAMVWAEVLPPSTHHISAETKTDTRFWSLPKFLKLMAKGDMVALETRSYLLSPEFQATIGENEGVHSIINLITEFPCHFARSIGDTTSAYIRGLIRDRYYTLDIVDSISDILLRGQFDTLENSLMVPKKAYQMVRIINQVLKYSRDGFLNFPLDNTKQLVDIKLGVSSPIDYLIELKKTYANQWLTAFGLGEEPSTIQLSNHTQREFEQWEYSSINLRLTVVGFQLEELLRSMDQELPSAVV